MLAEIRRLCAISGMGSFFHQGMLGNCTTVSVYYVVMPLVGSSWATQAGSGSCRHSVFGKCWHGTKSYTAAPSGARRRSEDENDQAHITTTCLWQRPCRRGT